MKRKALFTTLIFTLVVLQLFTGCTKQTATPVATVKPTATATQATATATPSVKRGGILKIGDSNVTTYLGYPQKMTAGWVKRQASPAIESLMKVDSNGKLIPWLATDWKSDITSESITLTLRTGVKFHDGTDFNAEAVKWNLEQAMATKQYGATRIASVDMVDAKTVKINLLDWDNTVLDLLGTSYIGMMISPTAFKAHNEEWAINNPVGTGPFQFVSWEKDVKITYKKFDGYWQQGKPYLDGVEFDYIVDPVTRSLSFQKGEIDINLNVPAKDFAEISKTYHGISPVPYLCAPNGGVPSSANPNSPWSKVEVRQAAQYAINTTELAQAMTFGVAEPATQWIFKSHWGYNPNIVGYPYNVEKAKQLLAQAGYPTGFDTSFMYMTNPDADRLYQAVANYLTAVGIRVKLNPVQAGTMMDTTLKGGTWDGLAMVGPPPYPDVAAGLRDRFMGGGMNYTQLAIPDDYKQALLYACAAGDFATKQKYTWDAEKLMIDKYCMILTFYFNAPAYAEQKYVRDTKLGTTPSENFEIANTWLDK